MSGNIDIEAKKKIYRSLTELKGRMERFFRFIKKNEIAHINKEERELAAQIIIECCRNAGARLDDASKPLGGLYINFIGYSDMITGFKNKKLTEEELEHLTHKHQETYLELEKCKKHYKPGLFEGLFAQKHQGKLHPAF